VPCECHTTDTRRSQCRPPNPCALRPRSKPPAATLPSRPRVPQPAVIRRSAPGHRHRGHTSPSRHVQAGSRSGVVVTICTQECSGCHNHTKRSVTYGMETHHWCGWYAETNAKARARAKPEPEPARARAKTKITAPHLAGPAAPR